MARGNFLNQAFQKIGSSPLPRPIAGPPETPQLNPQVGALPRNYLTDIQEIVAQGAPPVFDPGEPRIASNQGIVEPMGMNPISMLSDTADDGDEPPRRRRGTLDTIGQIGDALAIIGDSEPLYERGIDRDRAEEDRQQQLELNRLKIRRGGQELTEADIDNRNLQNEQLYASVNGLEAIYQKYGVEGVSAAWPMLAQQLGVPPAEAAQWGAQFEQDPERTILMLKSALGTQADDTEYGLNAFYAKDAQGNLVAYQLGKDGRPHKVQLDPGESPIDPVKVIDTGEAQVVIGGKTGVTNRVLPNFGGPDKGERPIVGPDGRITGYDAVPGSKLDKENQAGAAEAEADYEQKQGASGSALGVLDELEASYQVLKGNKAVVDFQNNSTGENIFARARSSGIGQLLEGFVGTESQAERDKIEAARSTMKLQIIDALDLSSRAIDSEKEAEAFMKTVTDPRTDVSAAQAAIDRMRGMINGRLPSDAVMRQKQRAAGRKPPKTQSGSLGPLERIRRERARRRGAQ